MVFANVFNALEKDPYFKFESEPTRDAFSLSGISDELEVIRKSVVVRAEILIQFYFKIHCK